MTSLRTSSDGARLFHFFLEANVVTIRCIVRRALHLVPPACILNVKPKLYLERIAELARSALSNAANASDDQRALERRNVSYQESSREKACYLPCSSHPDNCYMAERL